MTLSRTLLHRFLDHASEAPKAPAVEDGNTRWTYGELRAVAASGAAALRSAGAGPEGLVVLCAGRGGAAVAAMLSAWWCGAAVAVVDPEQPPLRLAGMLRTLSAHQRRWGAGGGRQRLPVAADPAGTVALNAAVDTMFLDAAAGIVSLHSTTTTNVAEGEVGAVKLEFLEWDLWAAVGESPDPRVPRPEILAPVPDTAPPFDRLAYVLFTSGSSGAPKAVMGLQGALAALLDTAVPFVGAVAGERVGQFSPMVFDASLLEIASALVTGGTLVMIPETLRTDAEGLVRYVCESGLHRTYLPTAIVNRMVDRPWPAGALRRVFTGGDRLRGYPPKGVSWSLINFYGPTEATVTSLGQLFEPGEGEGVEVAPPIGEAFEGERAYIVDGNLAPVAEGAPGELLLGGEGIARGYLNDPARTAEAFVPDPFATTPGARVYRTGDRVRRDGDGPVHFVDRLDDQVQLRGLRVEPGEVEAALVTAPGIVQGVVQVHGAGAAARLVAYVAFEAASEAERGAAMESARRHVEKKVPAHMVPRIWVPLEALPMTPTGKVDRRRLPAPRGGGQGGPPRGPGEAQVARAWAKVLGLGFHEIGREDDFFALGGHSLAVGEVLSQLSREGAGDLSPATFFTHPKLATQAAALAGETPGAASGGGGSESRSWIDPLPPLRPSARASSARASSVMAPSVGAPSDAPPLSFAQERFWLLEQLVDDGGAPGGGSNRYSLPFALRLRGALNVAALSLAFLRLLERHRVLRAVFTERDGVPAQSIAPLPSAPLPLVDLSRLGPEGALAEVRELVTADTLAPFHLAGGPLARFRLLRLGPQDHGLLLNLHHISADGFSFRVLIRDLLALYGDASSGVTPQLAPLALTYEDLARWQRSWQGTAAFDALLAAWRRRLGSRPPRLHLPGTRQPPPGAPHRSAGRFWELPPSLVVSLQDLARDRGVTMFMLTLSAYAAVLGRWGGSTRLVVGTPVAGRDRAHLDSLVGCLVNTVVLVADLSGDPTFAEILERMRRESLEAFALQDMPYDKLVEAYTRQRGGEEALFSAFFTLQQLDLPPVDLPGVEVERLIPEASGGLDSKLELNLALVDAGGRLTAQLTFNTARYDEAVMERLFDHFRALLETAADSAERRLSRLPGPSEDELRELAVGIDAATSGETAAKISTPAPPEAAPANREVDARRAKLRAQMERLPPHLRERFARRLGVQGGGATAPAAASSKTAAPVAVPAVARETSTDAAPPPDDVTPPPRRSPEELLPVSFDQERLWFLDRFDPGEGTYNIPLAVPLGTAVSIPALESALRDAVLRHEALRARFVLSADGSPRQRFAAAPRLHGATADARLPVIDLRGLEGERLAVAEANRLMVADGLGGFDLAVGPPLRCHLLRLPDGDTLLVNVHHIAFDGTSAGLLARDLTAFYQARCGDPSAAAALPRLTAGYGDFAVAQRRRLAGDTWRRHLEFWRHTLAGAPPLLELPFDRPRPPVQTHRGDFVTTRLEVSAGARLEHLRQRLGVTPFLVLYAAGLLLLHRLTEERDLVLGTPVDGRRDPALESVVGFFVHSVVLRCTVDPQTSFSQLVETAREVALAAFEHGEMPFGKLVEELVPGRDEAHTPIFQVLLAAQGSQAVGAGAEATVGQAQLVPTPVAKVDLGLFWAFDPPPRPGAPARVGLVLNYNADRADATTAHRWAGLGSRLLEQALQDPEAPLATLIGLSAAQRHQLVVEYGSGTEIGAGTSIPEAFEACARHTPGALALQGADGRSFTYGEVELSTRHLARGLRQRGVGPEVVVALLLPRSPEMVMAALAVLRAGGAYLPMDPVLPTPRVAYMAENSGAVVLLTVEGEERVADEPVLQRLALTFNELIAQGRGLEAAGIDDPLPGARHGDHQLAYVLYTSGSTGQPKGVAIPHGCVARLLEWHHRSTGMTPRHRVGQYSGLSFDVSVLEIWPPLTLGASLYLVDDDVRLDPRALAAWVRLFQVHQIFFSTPVAEQQMQVPAMLDTELETMLIGGDRLRRRPPEGAPWIVKDHYGPTETTVIATTNAIAPASQEPGPPRIGGPMDGAQLYVLDPRLRPVPMGCAGHSVIGGTGVGRGYLGRPRQTAETYRPNPFSGLPGDRMYLTGDLVRYFSSGKAIFLQRMDFQVKIRGQRIELGEIEAVLSAMEEISETVVVVREAGDKSLVAYLVPAATADAADAARLDAALAPAALRQRLREQLAPAMVPAAFVRLQAMPLNANGKIDRRALPAPTPLDFGVRAEGEGGSGGVEGSSEGSLEGAVPRRPLSPLEATVAQLWTELLGVAPGRDDDFFELGGHSLMAAQAARRLSAALEVEVTLRDVFRQPTLGELAALLALRRSPGAHGAAALAPIPRRPEGEPIPLSVAQSRLWFFERLVPGTPVYNIPLAVDLEGVGLEVGADGLQAGSLARALSAIVERHESLRTTFHQAPVDIGADELWREPRQQVHDPAPVPLPVVDLLRLEPAAAVRVARELESREAGIPFDLTTGPPLRARLLRRPEAPPRLLLTVHHLVADGASLEILERELQQAYAAAVAALEAGRAAFRPPWSELPLQYGDFAHWQRRELDPAAGSPRHSFAAANGPPSLTAAVEERCRRLRGFPTEIELPSDRPRPARLSYAGGLRWRPLAPATVETLMQLSRRLEVTPFVLFTAAAGLLVSRLADLPGLLLATPSEGRQRPELAPLVGFFVNTLVLPVPVAVAPTFAALAAAVRTETLAAFDHEDVPFEALVEGLGLPRSASRAPLSQVAVTATFGVPAEAMADRGDEDAIAKGDLFLSLTLPPPSSLGAGSMEALYARDLFDGSTAARWLASLEHLLLEIATNPEMPPGALSPLPPAQRHQAVVEAVGPESSVTLQRPPYGRWEPWEPVHLGVAQHAAADPGMPALEGPGEGGAGQWAGQWAGECWTYGQLALAAAGGAAALGPLPPETPVVLLLEPSPALAASGLAVLAAGGTFLCLEPRLPDARLRELVEDFGAAVGFADPGLEERLAVLGVARPLLAPAAPDPAAVTAAAVVAATAGWARPPALQAAYVVYTSGSTGRPKGVVISHGALGNMIAHVHTVSDRAGVERSRRRTSQLASLAFDAAQLEIWPTLAAGDTLCFVPAAARRDPWRLAQWLVERRIHRAMIPTPLAEELLREPDRLLATVADGELEAVLTGGDRQHFRPPKALPFWWSNAYGPAEAAVLVTEGTLEPEGDANRDLLPDLGRALAGVSVRVVDRDFAPQPTGVVGEMVLGGASLARGYLGRAGETAAAFVPNPFSSRPGARLYRTGDGARRRADDRLDFAGRLDRQLQVRGVRIEPGEVEASLVSHAGVAEAVVGVTGPAGAQRLTAWVVPADSAASSVPLEAGLLRHATERLPDWMIPQAIVFLSAFPRTATGKIDRRALPAPDQPEPIAPRTPTEAAVATVVAEVLGQPTVDVEASFFALGGHSLSALRVLRALEERFRRQLPLAVFFQEQGSVAALAARLDAAASSDASSDASSSAAGPSADDPGDAAPQELEDGWQLVPLTFIPIIDQAAVAAHESHAGGPAGEPTAPTDAEELPRSETRVTALTARAEFGGADAVSVYTAPGEILLFAGADGDPLALRTLATALTNSLGAPVVGVGRRLPPSRASTASPSSEARAASEILGDLDTWATDIADAWARRQGSSPAPLRLAGWSFGAVLALQVALHLVELGLPVAPVVLLDPSPPVSPSPEPPTDARLRLAFAEDLVGSALSSDARSHLESGTADALNTLLDLGRETGVLPPGLTLPDLHSRFAAYRAAALALVDHVPDEWYGPVTLLAADHPDLQATLTAWDFLLVQLTVHRLPTSHREILHDPQAAERVVELWEPER